MGAGYFKKSLDEAICKYEFFLYHYYIPYCEVENLKAWEWVDLELHFFSIFQVVN